MEGRENTEALITLLQAALIKKYLQDCCQFSKMNQDSDPAAGLMLCFHDL